MNRCGADIKTTLEGLANDGESDSSYGYEGSALTEQEVDAFRKERLFPLKSEVRRKINTRKFGFESLVAASEVMVEFYANMLLVIQNHAPILLYGPSGSGKEKVAETIAAIKFGDREKLLPVNCASLSNSDLFESELFGHKKGAFTGAVRDKEGLVQAASDGAIFLDEIATLPLGVQAKILRYLQTGEYRPLGDTRVTTSTASIIMATNQNLPEMVRAGTFREDLFYRIRGFPLVLPFLRERKEDIPFLANIFLEQYRKDYPDSPESFSAEALGLLQSLSWPDNVRGLQNFVRHVCMTGKIYCFNGVIEPITVRVILREQELSQNDSASPSILDTSSEHTGFDGIRGDSVDLLNHRLGAVIYELRRGFEGIVRAFSARSREDSSEVTTSGIANSVSGEEAALIQNVTTAAKEVYLGSLKEASIDDERVLGTPLLDAFKDEPFDVQKVIILFAFQIASLLRKFNGLIDLKKLINVMKQELLKASLIQFCASQDNPLIVFSVRDSCDYILKRTQCRISPLKANLDKLLHFDFSEFGNFSAENNLPSYAFVCFFRLFKTSFTQSTIDFDLNKTLQFLRDLIIFFLLNKADISAESAKVSNSRVAQKLSLNTQSIINSLRRSEQSIRSILSTYPDLRICEKLRWSPLSRQL